MKAGRKGFGKTRYTLLRRRSTKALAARLPFGSLDSAYRRSVSEERQPNVSEGRMKARRVETAERVPFTPARPEALAKGDAKLISDLMNRLRRMKVKRLFRPKNLKPYFD